VDFLARVQIEIVFLKDGVSFPLDKFAKNFMLRGVAGPSLASGA
jgi:hypothetical protein